jgi:hypothetical protein
MRMLAGRKALVTGSSRGLGEIIAAGTPARFATAHDGAFVTRPSACPGPTAPATTTWRDRMNEHQAPLAQRQPRHEAIPGRPQPHPVLTSAS